MNVLNMTSFVRGKLCVQKVAMALYAYSSAFLSTNMRLQVQ